MKPRTPMMQQYFDAKASHSGVLMAMRVGDFYEFYGEDAEVAAAALEITLTGKEDGANGRIAMAGVPYHSIEKYLARLVSLGHKVALCDQVEDPKTAKGLVRRAVTRVLTPGTLVEDTMLQAGANNYLAAFCIGDPMAGLAVLDPSTGEFVVTEIASEQATELATQELARIRPAELLVAQPEDEFALMAKARLGLAVSRFDFVRGPVAERALNQHFGVSQLAGFGLGSMEPGLSAAAAVLDYAARNGLVLDHVDTISSYQVQDYMAMDVATRRALEISANLHDGSRRHTLLAVVDQTVTAFGSRQLKRWLEQPLLDRAMVEARLDAVASLAKNHLHRSDLRDCLKPLHDLERLVSRCVSRLATPRDLAALRQTLLALPQLKGPLQALVAGRLEEVSGQVGDHSDLASLLERALMPEVPVHLRDGGVIADGFDAELDEVRHMSREGRQYIAEIEARERERTGISGLKIGFNSVFGYYLEVSKAHADKVPGDYIRKQTTANAERYVTAELKDREAAVLGAGERSITLETEIFSRIRSEVASNSRALLQTARALGEIDALAGFGEVSARMGFKRPEISEEDIIHISGGRHPVVEANSPQFVPNDTDLAEGSTRLMVLTGPNMSGKSTYLRQIALIVLLAQVGCFVPARACRIGLCDRIFARIGAKDEIALGQSTFMVEMLESAYILNHASSRSLVLFDEVGRGTSTFDGLAIAWAMIERLADLGSKTVFATHYHQLNQLADQLVGVQNFRVSVKEVGDDIIWTHRVLPGGTDRSYGIHVAKMAGLPRSVVERAKEVLNELEGTVETTAPRARQAKLQLTLFEAEEPQVLKDLREIDVDSLTPLQAIQILGDLQRRS